MIEQIAQQLLTIGAATDWAFQKLLGVDGDTVVILGCPTD